MPDTSSLPSAYNSAQLRTRVKGYPLLRDTGHYTYRETYLQNVANFARTALDTAHADVSALKLVDEDILNQREDLVEFFRLYATVPAAWDEPVTVRFDFPGYVGSWGAVLGTEVTSGVTMANSGTGGRAVVTKTAHGLAANSYVRVKYSSGSGLLHTLYALIESATTDTFTLDMRWVGTVTFSSVSYAVASGYPSRGIRTRSLIGYVRHEYALPGVTSGVTTAADFLPLRERQFISSALNEGTPVTFLHSSTDPTSAEWVAAARAGSSFVRDSTVGIYLGNILERVTTYVPFIL